MKNGDLSTLKIDRSVKSFKPRRRKGWISLGVVFVLAGVAVFLYAKGFISPAVSVEVVTISQIYLSQTLSQLNASGYVVAQRKAAVASKVTGRLVALMVEEGSRVKEGQVIARLENEDVLAGLRQAEANLRAAMANLESGKAQLEEATRTYTRYKQLVEGGYMARSAYDTAEASYQRAQAQVAAAEATINAHAAGVQSARVALEYTLIKAPFDAVVLTKNADIGDIVTPLGAAANAKASVVAIADLNSLQVEADVTETNLGLVKKGEPCVIQLDALPGSRFRGLVYTIVPTVDRSKATILVKIRFLEKDQRILPEMRAKVTFLSRPLKEGEDQPRTVIPPAALMHQGGRSTAFVVRSDHVFETPVRAGPSLGDMLEVLEGVKAGDRVVVKPSKRLRNGSKIKVLEK